MCKATFTVATTRHVRTRRWDLSIWDDVIMTCMFDARERQMCRVGQLHDLQDGNKVKRTNEATTKAMYNLSGPIIHTWDASTKQTML